MLVLVLPEYVGWDLDATARTLYLRSPAANDHTITFIAISKVARGATTQSTSFDYTFAWDNRFWC